MVKSIFIALVALLLALLFWEWSIWTHPHWAFVLPAPSSIGRTLIEFRQRLWFHASCTLKEMLCGFFLALGLAFPLALIMHRFKKTRLLLQPLFLVIQCLPMFTLAPMMVMWFGWSFFAVVVPTALMIFFPLTLNIYQGLRATPREHEEFFKLHKASYWATLTQLRIPYALPHIFAGFRISSAIAGVGAIAGEWAGAQSGLGVLMLESRRNTDLEITFAALVILTCMTSGLYLMMLKLENLRKWPQNLSSIALSALILLCTTSCSSSTKKTRLMLDWLPNVNHVPLYVGVEKGFFNEEDIDLTILKMYDSSTSYSYLSTQKADLILTHLPSVLKATSKGAELTLISPLIEHSLRAIIYRDSPEIKQPKDLSGKRLGYCIGSNDTSFLDYLLTQCNITPKSAKNVSVDLISPIATNKVDFIYGAYWNIEPHQLRMHGVPVNYFSIEEMGLPTFYELLIAAKRGSYYASQDFRDSFSRALKKSISFCQNSPEESFEIYLAANPDKSFQTKQWEREAWKETCPLFCKTLEFNEQVLESFLSWQVQNKMLDHTFPLGPLLD